MASALTSGGWPGARPVELFAGGGGARAPVAGRSTAQRSVGMWRMAGRPLLGPLGRSVGWPAERPSGQVAGGASGLALA